MYYLTMFVTTSLQSSVHGAETNSLKEIVYGRADLPGQHFLNKEFATTLMLVQYISDWLENNVPQLEN